MAQGPSYQCHRQPLEDLAGTWDRFQENSQGGNIDPVSMEDMSYLDSLEDTLPQGSMLGMGWLDILVDTAVQGNRLGTVL